MFIIDFGPEELPNYLIASDLLIAKTCDQTVEMFLKMVFIFLHPNQPCLYFLSKRYF